MPEYLSPGVYIEEIERGPKPIEGVATSTAAFLGETQRGPLIPTLVTSYSEYLRLFGDIFDDDKYMPYAVKMFFDNGGRRCYVTRIVGARCGAGHRHGGGLHRHRRRPGNELQQGVGPHRPGHHAGQGTGRRGSATRRLPAAARLLGQRAGRPGGRRLDRTGKLPTISGGLRRPQHRPGLACVLREASQQGNSALVELAPVGRRSCPRSEASARLEDGNDGRRPP